MKKVLGVLGAACLIVVAGCGGSTGSDEDQIKDLMSSFAGDLKNKEYGNACEKFSPAAIEEMESEDDSDGLSGGDCEGYMMFGASFISDEDLEKMGSGEMKDLVITGDTATAANFEDDGVQNFEKVDGEWKFGPEESGDSSDSSSGLSLEGDTENASADAPGLSDARLYVNDTLVPYYKSELKKKGADLFGDVSVKCAPTGGPETECALEIPYRRLDECAVASGSVFTVMGEDGVETTPESGELDVGEQLCYIGENGPVPSAP
ncbi:MAG TPA: hypothetical protein VMF31_00695 [Solirubrobacterales bacterium]|nr:hypothetical protein [Solirubrobacterales bacterium]